MRQPVFSINMVCVSRDLKIKNSRTESANDEIAMGVFNRGRYGRICPRAKALIFFRLPVAPFFHPAIL